MNPSAARYTLRMQFGLQEDPHALADRLTRLAKNARIDEIAVFYFAEELNDGHDTLERIGRWNAHSRVYRKALAEAGVALTLNPWHSLLHDDRGRKPKPEQRAWQRMVGPNGAEADVVVCPLDPGWRQYYREALRLYAREGYRAIWLDDDIRLHNHGVRLGWGGCFCPLHVAEFNRRAGTRATREEIVARCLEPGAPHPWRAIWLDMWEDTQLQMVGEFRRIVEDGGSRLGLMSSEMGAHASEGRRWQNWWAALAGDGRPIHRPHFWGYGDTMPVMLPDGIARLDQNRMIQPAGIESGPEIECFTYGRWHKSFRQLHAQMAVALIMGSNNLNISLYDFMGNDPDDEPERETFLRDWRPCADWLASVFPMTLKPIGVGIPWSQDMGRALRTPGPSEDWRSLVCPSRGWAVWLGTAGHAFAMRPQDTVNALAGPVAWAFPDDQLREWLAKGLLLDGVAASVLVERGLGACIGFEGGRFTTQSQTLYAVEQCTQAAFSLRVGAQMGVNLGGYSERLYQGRLMPGVQVASDVRGPTQNVVGHGLTLFENALGGRVAVVPWDANRGAAVMNVQRAVQLTKTLDWLARGQPRGSAAGGPWLVPQFLTDGRLWRGVVWNASPDEIAGFEVTLPRGMPVPAAAVQVDAHGRRYNARFAGGRVILDRPMHQWEFVVLV